MDTTGLIRFDLIEAAHKRCEDLQARLTTARADLVQTDETLRAATAASTQAVKEAAGGAANGTVLDIEKTVRESEAHKSFTQRVVVELEAQIADALAAIGTAKGEAHRPLLAAGIAARVAAARKAETARGMLAEAEAEYRAAAKPILAARDAGARLHQHLDGALLQGAMKTAKQESAFWSDYA